MGFTQDRSADLAEQIDPGKPRSVILLIGDGMDDSMITAARNYSVGAAGRLALDELPFTGAMTTYGLKAGAGPDYPIAYVSDSARPRAASRPARRPSTAAISQGPSAAENVPGRRTTRPCWRSSTRSGKRTGDVSTAEITDATPAAAAAHVNARACQDPTDDGRVPDRAEVGRRQGVDRRAARGHRGRRPPRRRAASRFARPLEDGSRDAARATPPHEAATGRSRTAAELDAVDQPRPADRSSGCSRPAT